MIATMGHKGTRRRKRNTIESEKMVKMLTIHRQQRQQVLGSHKVKYGACVECKEVFTYENENIVSSDQMDKF